MALPEHPIRPLTRALRSVLRRTTDGRLWLPFVVLGVLKLLLVCGLARIDLVPAVLLEALARLRPEVVEALHYPRVILRLPDFVRWLDLVVFVSVGALVHGWAIVHLTSCWTGTRLRLLPDWRRGVARVLALMCLALLLVLGPVGVRVLGTFMGAGALVAWAALLSGLVVQALLFAAPAFRVVDDVSIAASIGRSVRLLAHYPVAVPLAVVLLMAIHTPPLLLRSPALLAGAHHDPDWIVVALVAQVPVDVVGAFLAAGLAARFVLSSEIRRKLT